MINYKDQLAKLATQMGKAEATANATEEQNEAKRQYGRIFQTNHTSLRLAERELEIDREALRPKLLEVEGDDVAFFNEKTNTYIPAKRQPKANRADDWMAITVYNVKNLEAAKRKAANKNQTLLVF